MPEMNCVSPYSFGERVIIDGDPSLVARIVEVSFKANFADIETSFPESQISYVHGGEIRHAWIATWRLSPAPSE